MTERNTDDGLTKPQAATKLSTSIRTVERYIAAGHITAIKRPNGRVLVDANSVDAFLKGEPALAEGGESQ